MDGQTQAKILKISAAALAATAALAFLGWGISSAAGVLAGGAWHLSSLWCLAKMLNAWLGPKPSQKKAVAWVLVKFPLLYFAVFALFQNRLVPFAAFSVGFSVVLLIAIASLSATVRKTLKPVKVKS